MISYSGTVGLLDMSEQGFGAPPAKMREQGKQYKDSYVEGPWIRKVPEANLKNIKKKKERNAKRYQLIYAAGGIPEHISYSTAPSPAGPWAYAGVIMPQSDTKSFTNHAGVADYKGHSYFFYHTGKLPHGGGFGRSVAVEAFKYNADGSFPMVEATDEGVKSIATFQPFRKTEAETMAFSKGVKTEENRQVGVYVTDIHNGDYIKLKNVDFVSRQPKIFTARVASGLRGGQIEVRLDSIKGQLLGRLEVPATGGWENWQTISAQLSLPAVASPSDLYFVFTGRKGPKLFNFDWWKMD